MRTGKIARLPHHLRLQVNRRLADSEPGRFLLGWLNALPEVRTILQRDFDSRDISDQNLSEWKQGGYREWLSHQEALDQIGEIAANADELAGAARGRISDHLATLLAARYATALAAWDGVNGEDLQRKVSPLRDLCRNVVELRRGDHEVARLQLEQTRLDRDRDKTDEEILQYFLQWSALPKVRNSLQTHTPASHPAPPQLHSLFTGDKPENPPPSQTPESLTDVN